MATIQKREGGRRKKKREERWLGGRRDVLTITEINGLIIWRVEGGEGDQ